MHGYPYKYNDIQIDIHKSMDNSRLIAMTTRYPFIDVYYLRISIAECPFMDIHAWISMWIFTFVWILKD